MHVYYDVIIIYYDIVNILLLYYYVVNMHVARRATFILPKSRLPRKGNGADDVIINTSFKLDPENFTVVTESCVMRISTLIHDRHYVVPFSVSAFRPRFSLEN